MRTANLLQAGDEEIRKAEKQAEANEKLLRRKNPTPKPRPTTVVGRAAQFSTYLPFPYERTRQRVLAWFAAPEVAARRAKENGVSGRRPS